MEFKKKTCTLVLCGLGTLHTGLAMHCNSQAFVYYSRDIGRIPDYVTVLRMSRVYKPIDVYILIWYR